MEGSKERERERGVHTKIERSGDGEPPAKIFVCCATPKKCLVTGLQGVAQHLFVQKKSVEEQPVHAKCCAMPCCNTLQKNSWSCRVLQRCCATHFVSQPVATSCRNTKALLLVATNREEEQAREEKDGDRE